MFTVKGQKEDLKSGELTWGKEGKTRLSFVVRTDVFFFCGGRKSSTTMQR